MRYILTLLFFLSFLFSSFAQCLPNGITFTTQQEIDDFPSNYPGCTKIGGSVVVGQSTNGEITNLDSLSSITSIGGNLVIGSYNIENPQLVSLEGLGNLDSIGGYCSISRNDKLSNLVGFESLSSLDYLVVGGNSALTSLAGFESLSSIDTVEITFNSVLVSLAGFENVNMARGIVIYENPMLTDLAGFNNLGSVGELSISQNNSLVNLMGFENLSQIGDLSISYNDGLISLQGLGNNPSLTKHLFIGNNPNLETLDGLESANSIGGNLEIRENSSLKSLTGLGNVGKIGGNLRITKNSALESLDGLENVSSIDGYMKISDNDALTSITGIQNIDPTSIKNSWTSALSLYNNKNLSSCAVTSVCGVLAIPSKSYAIQNNASGCNSAEQIDCANNYISGVVFFDQNKNGHLDENENGIPNHVISIAPDGLIVLTNKKGEFRYYVEAGSSYEIAWKSNEDFYLTSDSASYSIPEFNSSNSININNNFGIYLTAEGHKGIININSNQTRCNTEVDFIVDFQNTGTFDESGLVQVSYDSTATFIGANFPIAEDTINHLLLIDYDSIAPFEYRKIKFVFAMPDQNGTGDTLEFKAKFRSNSTGQEELLDSDEYTPIVLCSFDPNDKLVMPAGVQDSHYTLHNEQLTYTIRFQNTGNAEAIDITILDTLDSSLDVSTLRMVNSSFPVQTTIDDQKIKFYFRNIWLPDSTHNESKSHGFVTYEISPIAGLEDNVEITNTAHIIFDSNEAIVTNSTLNTMVTSIPVGFSELPKEYIRIHPNPTSSIFYIEMTNVLPLQKVRLFDVLGREVLAQKGSTIDVSDLPKGIYTVKVEFTASVGWAKVLVE